MNKPLRVLVLLGYCAFIALILFTRSGHDPKLVPAPPGPVDLGPASGLSILPSEAIVFDLKYRAQTGAADDISSHSFWGYGGSTDQTQTNSFLQEVQNRAQRVHFVFNHELRGRNWSAVEYHGRHAMALYFDLNGDGRLDSNERIAPSRKVDESVEFITPDFANPLEDGGQTFCRVLLQVRFYEGQSEPNCMWSPACLLEGVAELNGQPARLLLHAGAPARGFEKFGSSGYSLLLGNQSKIVPDQYVPRESLSSIIFTDGQFYRLSLDGRRSNGLPARVVLTKDKSPTGTLVLQLNGSNGLQCVPDSLFLHGIDNDTVHFRITSKSCEMTVPGGTYALDSGLISYGATNGKSWQVSFSAGPRVTAKAGEVLPVNLGEPGMKLRAITERDRYNREAKESTSFARGTRLYFEPKITGKGGEVLTRFRQPEAPRGKEYCPPQITIIAPDGRQLLSKTMEYG